jgi:hypothetical protein
MSAYATPVSIQKLFAIFVALAVLIAPAFSRAGEAFAAVPVHHAEMTEADHCKSMPTERGHQDKAPAKICCTSMCMAVAVVPAAPIAEKMVQAAPPVFAVPSFHLGHLAEIATPPPRSA